MASDTVLERRVCQEGTTIFREGDRGDCAYIVQKGRVEIVKSSGGSEIVIGAVGEGGIFGEMALLDDQPRMATARAAEMAIVIIVTRRTFEQKLAKTDPFIRRLLQIFAENIRALTS